MTISVDSKFVKLISSRLRNFKQKNVNLWNFSCPFCGDSQKNKTKARGYVFPKENTLLYRCHNCGVSTNAGTSLNKSIRLYTQSMYLKDIQPINPIQPLSKRPTQQLSSSHQNSEKLKSKKHSNMQNGSANSRVDIFV